jgi:2-keto-4-pentenoate hydratase/2-oxohepta-3-ene-1,7-dioic acid hydratase in catechol pathway
MTRRDLQRAMGDEKKPWEIGKSFDHSAPLGPLHRVADIGHFTEGAIQLRVNGAVKQNANLTYMIWSVAEQIAGCPRRSSCSPATSSTRAPRRTSGRSCAATS